MTLTPLMALSSLDMALSSLERVLGFRWWPAQRTLRDTVRRALCASWFARAGVAPNAAEVAALQSRGLWPLPRADAIHTFYAPRGAGKSVALAHLAVALAVTLPSGQGSVLHVCLTGRTTRQWLHFVVQILTQPDGHADAIVSQDARSHVTVTTSALGGGTNTISAYNSRDLDGGLRGTGHALGLVLLEERQFWSPEALASVQTHLLGPLRVLMPWVPIVDVGRPAPAGQEEVGEEDNA